MLYQFDVICRLLCEKVIRALRRRVLSRADAGLTLLELLVVTAIIGVLAAAALPQLQHKGRALDAQAQAALRAVALAEESYFIAHNEYVSCDQITCPTMLGHIGELPPGVVLEIVADTETFSGTAYHSAGTGKTFNWN